MAKRACCPRAMRMDCVVWWEYGEGGAVTLSVRPHDRAMVEDGVDLSFYGACEGWRWTWCGHESGRRQISMSAMGLVHDQEMV